MQSIIKKSFFSLKETYNKISKNYLFIFNVIVFLCGYGYALFNQTVGTDDLALNLYLNKSGGFLSGCRWVNNLLLKIIGISTYSPCIMTIVGLVFYLLSSLVATTVIDNADSSCSPRSLNVFVGVYITFPLILEIFNYNPTFLVLSFSLLVSFFSVLLVAQSKNKISLVLIGCILTLSAAGYESSIAAYITLVMIAIYIKNKQKRYNWFLDGLRYVVPLLIAIILRYVIGLTIIKFLKVEYMINGNGSLSWGSQSLVEIINNLKYNLLYYFVRGDIYLPISVFVFSVLIFIVIGIVNFDKNRSNSIVGVLIVVSLFSLSLLQGNYMAYRTAQTIQVFVAFVMYLLVNETEKTVKISKVLKTIILGLVFLLPLRQAVYLHNILALNIQRTNNEAYIARTIGYKLYSEYDITKTVIFCGEYNMGNYINKQISVNQDDDAGKFEMFIRRLIGHDESTYCDEFIKTNVNSVINWGTIAFNSQTMMQELLSYYGFDIKVVNSIDGNRRDFVNYYESIAKQEGMNSLSIKDMGEYILVYLGPTASN